MRLLALDPGLTLGIAVLEIHLDTMQLLELIVTEERTEHAKAFDSLGYSYLKSADVVVIEDFVGAGIRTVESTYTIKMIGAFEMAALSRGLKFKTQTPASRKPFLKEGAAFYKSLKGKAPCHHGRDALAHALKYVYDEYSYNFQRWLCDF